MTIPLVRTRLTAATTFYVDKTNGNDNDPGTAGAPWATLENACVVAMRDLDFATQVVEVQLADSATPYPGIHYAGLLMGAQGGAQLKFRGNAANPWLTRVEGNAGSGFACYNGNIIQIQDLVVGSVNGGHGLEAGYNSQIYVLGGVTLYGASNIQIYAAEGGLVQLTQNFKVAGSAQGMMQCDGRGSIKTSGAITCDFITDAAYSFRIFSSYGQSIVSIPGMTWNKNGHSVTGQTGEVARMGMIYAGVAKSALPGDGIVGESGGGNYQ